MSKLNTIMTMQNELQKRLGTDFTAMSAEERAKFMRDHFVYLVQELNEALYEMPFFKSWKDYSDMSEEAKEAAWQKVQMELVDALHFFMNLLLCSGMTAEDVYKMYMAKNAENHKRQDKGYTADVSYKDQSVDEVMTAEPTCTVVMDDAIVGSSDFAAVVFRDGGSASVLYNADTLSMVAATRMLAIECTKLLKSLPEEEQKSLKDFVDEMLPIAGGVVNE